MKTNELGEVLREINTFYVDYRSNKTSPYEKLAALWNIGNVLILHEVSNPHSFGWKIQGLTRGGIKRPTIFRAFKYRKIWGNEDDLRTDCEGLKSLSNVVDALPFLDPDQSKRYNLSTNEVRDLKYAIRAMGRKEFKDYINKFKEKHRVGRIGEKQNRTKYVEESTKILSTLAKVYNEFSKAMVKEKVELRQNIRDSISGEELQECSRILSALTTEENSTHGQKKERINFVSKWDDFSNLGNSLSDVLYGGQRFRKKLRRLSNSSIFLELADMMYSMTSEAEVNSYLKRKNLSMGELILK